MYQIKRRYVTLIEIMIVITLISIILVAVGYNYYGGLEQGKVFHTKMGIEKLENILNLRAAGGESPEEVRSRWKAYVQEDPLVKDPNALIKDGWGAEYQIEVEDNMIRVRSENYEHYLKKKSQRTR